MLVFVSSRRQTRLTALDLIGHAAADERPRQFVHCPEEELEQALWLIKAQPLHLFHAFAKILSSSLANSSLWMWMLLHCCVQPII